MTAERSLDGKVIVFGVTGSIAAVETIKIVHELRRKGAMVQVVMSKAAKEIVHPQALAYASGREVITHLTGLVEHVTYCGDGGCADLLLIAPCTANTISKIAAGIDDTTVTTFASAAIGAKKPVIIVPAMHQSMFRHPALIQNLQCLSEWGIDIVKPRIEEGRAKMASLVEIILLSERALLGKPLQGKRVLITSGACREAVDDIRILTTRSTGIMGRELALQAFRLGGEVTVIHDDNCPCVSNIHAETAREMRDAVLRFLNDNGAHIYLSAAAISDFAPNQRHGKIPSGKLVTLELQPLPKLIDYILKHFSLPVVAFKLGWNEERAAQNLLRKGACIVVTNTPEAMGKNEGIFILLQKTGKKTISGSKHTVASALWEEIIRIM